MDHTVFTLMIDYLSYVANRGVRRQKLRKINAFLTRYSLSHLAVLDVIGWLSQFYQFVKLKLPWAKGPIYRDISDMAEIANGKRKYGICSSLCVITIRWLDRKGTLSAHGLRLP